MTSEVQIISLGMEELEKKRWYSSIIGIMGVLYMYGI